MAKRVCQIAGDQASQPFVAGARSPRVTAMILDARKGGSSRSGSCWTCLTNPPTCTSKCAQLSHPAACAENAALSSGISVRSSMSLSRSSVSVQLQSMRLRPLRRTHPHFFEDSRKFDASSIDSRFHCSFRHLKHRSNFLVFESLQVTKDHGLAQLG